MASTIVRSVALATALLTVAGPVGVAAAAETTSHGTAATTSVPLHVEAGGVPVDLGTNVLTATTDGDVTDLAPWSAVGLTLANIDGARFGDLEVRSDGATQNAGSSVDRSTAAGDVGATAGNLLALADETAGTATAALTTLSTDATVLEGLGLDVTITDVIATVDDTGAAANHSLALAGVDLDLAHLLGSVLDQLPLDDLLALADELGVEVPVDLSAAGDVAAATEALLTAVADATAAATAVEDAAAALVTAEQLDPLADYGDIDAYQTLLTTLEGLDPVGDPAGTLTAVQTILADADFVALGCTVADPTTELAQAIDDAVSCIEDHLSAYASALAALADELTALTDAVQAYLDAVTAATDAAAVLSADSDSLAAIVDQITALVEDLLAAELFSLSPVNVTQQVRAVGGDLDASSASHTCSATLVGALGGDPIQVDACDGADEALAPVLTAVTDALDTVLSTVGGVDLSDDIVLSLFGTVDNAVAEDADGVVTATSQVEVLRLEVPDVTITPCDVADGLACGLGIDLEGTLADALTALDGVLDAAHTTVTDALTAQVLTIVDLLGGAIDVTGADGAQATVDAAIAALQAALDGLDLLELGTADATLNGVTVVVDPELEAEHAVVVATDDPVDPAPDPDDPSLPNTGGGAALLAVLAIGAGAWLWRRREQDVT